MKVGTPSASPQPHPHLVQYLNPPFVWIRAFTCAMRTVHC